MKYLNAMVTFAEVPAEICLTFSITGCPHNCFGCNQPELRRDIGQLVFTSLAEEIAKYPYITCVCLLGGDGQHEELAKCADEVHRLGKKVCVYSGDDEINAELAAHLDYYKVGHWDHRFGPLNSKTTNQRLYKINGGELEDITYIFWDKENLKL